MNDALVGYGVTNLGLGIESAVQDWDVQVANNLALSYYAFGNGRFELIMAELERKVTGKATLGFESNDAWQLSLGAQKPEHQYVPTPVCGPQSVIPGNNIEMLMATTDILGTPRTATSTAF